MILRRLVDALRRQDWATVLIEFLIVVIGIFVGLQVNNWNEARVFANQERAYLQQLRDELADNQRALRYQIEFTDAVIDGGRRALERLESGAPCQPRCAELLVDLFHASQVWGTPLATASYEELKRLGLPSDIALREQLQPYYRYLAGWETVNLAPPAFRERIRGHLSPAAFEVLWSGCYRITNGEVEALESGCVETLRSAVDAPTIAASIAADAALPNQLRFWIGQNIYAAIYYPEMSGHADAAIAALDRALGDAAPATD